MAQKTKSHAKAWTQIFEKPLVWLVIVLTLFIVPLYFSFRSPQPTLPPVLGEVPNFTLVNQDGREIRYSTEFRGSVLLVNFIFTTCPDVCPLISKQMAKIQHRLITSAPIIRLVSITVDPDTDTPEVIKQYAESYGARPRSWTFLTGDLMQIYDTVVNGFKVAMDNPGISPEQRLEVVQDPQQMNSMDVSLDLMEITHGEHFVLVDQVGQIRAYMLGNNDEQLNRIVQTLGLLANTNPSKAPQPAAR
jgi:protein SCO1